MLVGVPGLFHLHRLQAAFELFAVLLAAWGLERTIAAAMRAPRLVTIAAGAALGAAILLLALDRAEFLRLNTLWGETNLAAFDRERGNLEAALADVPGNSRNARDESQPGRGPTGEKASKSARLKFIPS